VNHLSVHRGPDSLGFNLLNQHMYEVGKIQAPCDFIIIYCKTRSSGRTNLPTFPM
jgi:hypothetical protein